MSPTNLLDLIFQAARNGSENQFYEAIYQSKRTTPVISDLLQCNRHGDSPLHVAIKSGHHNLVECMLNLSKDRIKFVGSKRYIQDPNCKEKSVIKLNEIANNVFGISKKFPVLYTLKYLINPAVNDEILWLKFLLDCVKVSTITRPEKIVALEVLGASFIFQNALSLRSHQNNNEGYFMGIKCWKKALALRKATDDGGPALPKIPCDLPDICRNLFGNNVEFVTSNQLDRLEEQLVFYKSPENCQILCGIHGPLVTQALLVIQRIWGETSNELHIKFWFAYGSYCFTFKEYSSRSFDVFHLILNEIKKHDCTPSPKCLEIFSTSLYNMLTFLIETRKNQLENPKMEKVKLADLVNLIKYNVTLGALLLKPIPTETNEMGINSSLMFFRLSDTIGLLVEIFTELNREEKQQLQDYLSEYTQKKFDTTFFSLLDDVVGYLCSGTQTVDDAIYIQMIQFLLAIGFDPNAITIVQNGSPLHSLATCWNKSSSPNSHRTAFLSLLDAGGNLDQKAKDGTTVRSVLKAQKKQLMHHDPYLESLINMSLPSSLCHLCARVIRQQKIPFDNLPSSLQSFVLCRRI